MAYPIKTVALCFSVLSWNLPSCANTQQSGYKNIIFDVGNVLLKWNPARIATHVGIDTASILQFVSSDHWKQWDMDTINRQELLMTLPASLDGGLFLSFLDLMPGAYSPLAEGIDILKAVHARGYHVYVLSNMPRESLDFIIHQFDFFTLFDGGIFSCQVHVAKPDVTIYQLLLQKYNLDPAESLFIDDSPQNIFVAKTIGIQGIVCAHHATVKNELVRLHILD
jgi:putative hydrolase of the HAD superfamily